MDRPGASGEPYPMTRTSASAGGGRCWAARLAFMTLLLGQSSGVAFVSSFHAVQIGLAEDTAGYSLADQRREFSLLPESSSAEDQPLRSWLLGPRELKTFTLATAGEAEEPVSTGPDWIGLGRDTALLIGYQAVAIGVIFLLGGVLPLLLGRVKG